MGGALGRLLPYHHQFAKRRRDRAITRGCGVEGILKNRIASSEVVLTGENDHDCLGDYDDEWNFCWLEGDAA